MFYLMRMGSPRLWAAEKCRKLQLHVDRWGPPLRGQKGGPMAPDDEQWLKEDDSGVLTEWV
jgi:hypothetical protein